MKKIIKNKSLIIYVAFFIIFTLIMYIVPHSVDDTYYDYLNFTNIKDIIHFSAGYGNGRVLGNAFAILMCKSQIAAALIRSFSVLLFIVLSSRFFEKSENKLSITILLCTLLVCVNSIIFGEVYSWISAFTNYFLPILLTIMCMYIIMYMYKSKWSIILLFIFGVASQLFSENSSLNNFIIAIMLFSFAVFKYKDRIKAAIVYLASTAIGAAVMIYCRLFVKDERSFYFNAEGYETQIDLHTIISNIIGNILKYIDWISGCFILIALLSFAVLTIMINNKNVKSVFVRNISCFVVIITPIYALLYYFIIDYAVGLVYKALTLGGLMLLAVYFSILIIVAIKLDKIKRTAIFATLFIAVFSAVSITPLSPINSRCLFYTYIAFVFVTAIYYTEALKYISVKKIKLTNGIICTALFVTLIIINLIVVNISIMNDKVNEYIETEIASGSTQVEVCKLTATDYYHHSYFSSRLSWLFYQKEPNDVEFVEISTEEWLEKHS